MTRREAIKQAEQERTLIDLGFTRSEAEALRRISMALHRWAEYECNGDIERDPERGDKPFWSHASRGGKHYASPVPDRERGALRRLDKIIAAHTARLPHNHDGQTFPCHTLRAYIQGDPRGCPLYVIRPGDVPEGKSDDGYYNNGLAVN